MVNTYLLLDHFSVDANMNPVEDFHTPILLETEDQA